MKYKLKDVRNVVEEDVQFGTCELCMSVGTLDFEVYVVEDENGKHYEFESGSWSWGDWFPYTYGEIENVIVFASWFSEQELFEGLTENDFWYEVQRYINDIQEGGETDGEY